MHRFRQYLQSRLPALVLTGALVIASVPGIAPAQPVVTGTSGQVSHGGELVVTGDALFICAIVAALLVVFFLIFYRTTVGDNYFEYSQPQETGNKVEVRWAALTNDDGIGLLAVGEPLLSVNALHYAAEDLDQALYRHQLARRDEVYLNLDWRQRGLGGDDSWGALPHEEYRMPGGAYAYRFRLRTLDTATESAMAWAVSMTSAVGQGSNPAATCSTISGVASDGSSTDAIRRATRSLATASGASQRISVRFDDVRAATPRAHSRRCSSAQVASSTTLSPRSSSSSASRSISRTTRSLNSGA